MSMSRLKMVLLAAGLILSAAVQNQVIAQEEEWTWVKMPEPKGLPLLGGESAAAFDIAAGKFRLYGGHLGNGGPQNFYTWSYDPVTNTWENSRPDNKPIGSCCVREGVYDEANQRTLLIGGHRFSHGWQWRAPNLRGGGVFPWAYDASANTWQPMKPPSARPGRPFSGVTYDSEHQVVIAYGGEGENGTDLWVYDGYSNTWTAIKESGKAGPGRGGMVPCMAFDREHKSVLMLCHRSSETPNVLWAYDLETNTWTRKQSAPKFSGYPIMVYDPYNRLTILFVSSPNKPLQAVAYDWGKDSWRELPTKGDHPPSHIIQVGAYDATHNQTILGRGFVYNGQMKEFQRPEATYILRHPTPVAAKGAGVAYFPLGKGGLDASSLDLHVEGVGQLRWKPVAGASAYAIYKGWGHTDGGSWKIKYSKLGQTAKPGYRDQGLLARNLQTMYASYYVVALDAKDRPVATSFKVRTQPRAPSEPVVSVTADKKVVITWKKNTDLDVSYNVYRVEKDRAVRLNSGMILGEKFETELPAGEEPAIFRVHAGSGFGGESGPSPWAGSIPSEPNAVRASLVDGKATVTWKPNPQTGIKGYNVYRLDSSNAKEIKRVAELVAGTRFVDANAPKLCKYYIVAVDALGREGYASFGAWFGDDARN